MFCTKCGNQFEGKFCSKCGEPVAETNPNSIAYQQQPQQQNYSTQQPKTPWCPQTWHVVLALILFFPVGIAMMWLGKWNIKIKIAVSIFFAIVCVIAVAGGGAGKDAQPADALALSESSSNSIVVSSEVSEPQKPEYSLDFQPDVTYECTDTNIVLTANVDSPDGTIIQVMVMSNDLSEMYNAEVAVENRQVVADFVLTNTNPKIYGGLISLQFNADSIVQPDNAKEIYGEHGENLTGRNAISAEFFDGSTGNNANYIFNVTYPNEAAVQEVIANAFSETAKTIVDGSNGVILSLTHPSKGIYHMTVSNQWYLSPETDKQYFAEEFLKNLTAFNKNAYSSEVVTFSIEDESGTEVATSKILGGMKIKR